MELRLPDHYQLSEEVARAISRDDPVVALESTVVTHGLPYPENLRLAEAMESELRSKDVVPATIAVVDGKICIGVNRDQLSRLAGGENTHKISTRDYATAIVKGWTGGTTVAATMHAAHAAGIHVFATGGIGGVHRALGENAISRDVSADLGQLGNTPVIVICAGAKAILDLEATLEYLETAGVPVVGYQTEDFPAFYSRISGLPTSARADTPGEVVALARAHWALRLYSAILVANPPPEETALPRETVEAAIATALEDAGQSSVRGQEVTPFLLARVSEITAGASLQANLALLLNNARLAAEIAKAAGKGPFRLI